MQLMSKKFLSELSAILVLCCACSSNKIERKTASDTWTPLSIATVEKSFDVALVNHEFDKASSLIGEMFKASTDSGYSYEDQRAWLNLGKSKKEQLVNALNGDQKSSQKPFVFESTTELTEQFSNSLKLRNYEGASKVVSRAFELSTDSAVPSETRKEMLKLGKNLRAKLVAALPLEPFANQ